MGRYRVAVERSFSGAHQIMEHGGKCERLHGHNWKVELELESGSLMPNGMVADFKDIKELLDCVLERLDHSFLNEVEPAFRLHPTAENIASFIFSETSKKLGDMQFNMAEGTRVSRVTVWETEGKCASFVE